MSFIMTFLSLLKIIIKKQGEQEEMENNLLVLCITSLGTDVFILKLVTLHILQ